MSLQVNLLSYQALERSVVSLVWQCCKDDQQSQWVLLKFDPATIIEPLKRSSPNLARVIAFWIYTFRQGKNGFNPIMGFFSPYTRNNAPRCSLRCDCLLRFFTVRRYALHGICYSNSVRPSVRLSVRLSVTLVDSVHMVRPTIMISSPQGSPIILVSGDITFIQKRRTPPPLPLQHW